MNNIRISRASRLFLLLALLLTSGCATIVKGSTQGVTVKTAPPGASCDLTRNGKSVGIVNPTPGTVQLGKGASALDVVCKKAGHLDANAKLTSTFQGWTLGNAILGGVVGLVVDAGSGAMHEYPSEISMTLLPESFASNEHRDAYFNARRTALAAQSENAKAQLATSCAKDQCEKMMKKADEKTAESLVQIESDRKVAVISPTATGSVAPRPVEPKIETISAKTAPPYAGKQ